MANEKNIIEPVFRGDVKVINNIDSLKDLLVTQQFYVAREGEQYTFDAENVQYRECIPQGATNPCVLALCMVKKGQGKPQQSWFNINSLKKRDADNNYVYPVFENMNAADIMAWLFEHKTLTVTGMKEIAVPTFQNGQRVTETVEINGNLVSKTVIRTQKCATFAELQ